MKHCAASKKERLTTNQIRQLLHGCIIHRLDEGVRASGLARCVTCGKSYQEFEYGASYQYVTEGVGTRGQTWKKRQH